jgi:carbon-monoxide dehydrogenase small subunit
MSKAMQVHTTVNGASVQADIEPRRRLCDFLRLDLGLLGTKVSCEVQVCGACTVLVDGLPISSCTYLAADVDGRQVTTIEGVASGGRLSVVQQALVDCAAVQCGFCTPGFVLAATALLAENPQPTRPEIQHYLEGNICRCSGYEQILEAVELAAHRTAATESVQQ